jgi:sialic acid synthase SpsE
MLKFGLGHFKVASSNARNHALLRECAERIPHDREIVISVGGSTLAQVAQALDMFPHHRVWLLHCVAQYPCPTENLRLGNVAELTRRFASDRVRIGYSGHEEGITPSLGAIAMGARMVERHFCLSRHSFVHHIECSLEPAEFKSLVEQAQRPERIAASRLELPPVAFTSNFGMSDVEKTFLVEQTYGTKFIATPSQFPPADDGAVDVPKPRPSKPPSANAA